MRLRVGRFAFTVRGKRVFLISRGRLIMPNLFNIKGLSADEGCSLFKDEPADSGQIGFNPKGGPYFGAFAGKPKPKGNDPVAPVFQQKSL
jgi:hypothetical protein